MAVRDWVFFSYRHDEQGRHWLSLIQRWLSPYGMGGSMVAWSDHDIRTGDLWESKIHGAIERSRVAVLLVNQTFFGSEYICNRELPHLLQAARDGRLVLVPVPIGPFDRRLTARSGLDSFQFTHPPTSPLSATVDHLREQTLTEVAVKVADAFEATAPASAAAPMAPTAPRLGAAVAPARGSEPTLSAAGPLFDVPPLDRRHFVERDEDLGALRDRLLHDATQVLGLTSTAPGVGLHGMGGMGKTELAKALCHDEAIRHAFPDGIAWVTLGQRPELLSLQNRLLRHYEPDAPNAGDAGKAQVALKAALKQKRALVVVDDIWDVRHFTAFDVVGPHGRLLLTTRDAAIVVHVRAQPHELKRLPLAAARRLLASWSGVPEVSLPAAAEGVVQESGALPLALALAGARAADGVSWSTLARQLAQGRLRFLDHPYGSVYDSLGRSVDSLDPEVRSRYLELAVFPEDAKVPVITVQRLWGVAGLNPDECEGLLARFARMALLILEGEGLRSTVGLHDLQHDFVRARLGDPTVAHARLLTAHRVAYKLSAGAAGWSEMPADEPYLWARLAMHLDAAGRSKELERGLLNLEFLHARLDSVSRGTPPRADIAAIDPDFSFVDNASPARKVARTLRRSAHVLALRPQQLSPQLFGRLGTSGEPALRTLAESARRKACGLLTPTIPGLAPPGALEFVLAGHQSPVCGALLLAEGRRALSWCGDGTVRLWDLTQPGVHDRLSGHEDSVNGALVLADGRRAITWSRDSTLRMWDLEQPGAHVRLSGHEDSVNGALLLPDGRRALSWSDDRTLRIWDLEHPGVHERLSGHQGWINGALLLPDGRRGLSWSDDRTLRLWSLDQPGSHKCLSGHDDWINGVLLFPDGRHALSWSFKGALCVWDLERPGVHQCFLGHEDAVNGALLIPDGRRVLSWSDDRTLRLWDLNHPGAHSILSGHDDSVRGALLLPDGLRALSWSTSGALCLWNLDQPGSHQRLTGHEGWVQGALLLPDGHRVLSWSNDRTLRVWNLEQPGVHERLSGHEGWVNGALLLPDSRHAMSWSNDGTVRLWDLEQQGAHDRVALHDDSVRGALLFPDGRQSLSWSNDRTLRLWNLEQPSEHMRLSGHEGWINGALLLSDGQHVLSWSDDCTLRLWNLELPGDHQRLAGHAGSVDGALLLPHRHLALSWSNDSTLRLWDLAHPGAHKRLSGHEDAVLGALLLSDGCRALSWSIDGTLRLWDLEHPGVHHRLSGHEDTVRGALLLANGRHALSWSGGGTLRLWDLVQPGAHERLYWHEGAVRSALLFPDGQRALSWTNSGQLCVWDLQHSGADQRLSGHDGSVNGAILLPDGHRVLSWSEDRTLRLWDLLNPGAPLLLQGHDDSVRGALLLPDGHRALSWSDDHTLRLWDLQRGAEIDLYVADASIATVVGTDDGRKVFVGDTLGYVQILSVSSP